MWLSEKKFNPHHRLYYVPPKCRFVLTAAAAAAWFPQIKPRFYSKKLSGGFLDGNYPTSDALANAWLLDVLDVSW